MTTFNAERFLRFMAHIERRTGIITPSHIEAALFYLKLDAQGKAWYAERYGSLDVSDEIVPERLWVFPDVHVLIDEYKAWRATLSTTVPTPTEIDRKP